MKDKDLLEESPKNIFHDLMISKIIKKKNNLVHARGDIWFYLPSFSAFGWTAENGEHNSLTIYKKVSHNFPMRVFVWEK